MIPEFTHTEEAVAFGRTHYKEKIIIQELRMEEEHFGGLADQRLGDRLINEATVYSTRSSLYREAREIAEGLHNKEVLQ